MVWWKENPEIFEDFQGELSDYPTLSWNLEGEKVVVSGKWHVSGSEKLIASFDIRIELPDNFPVDVPLVFETGGKIPKIPDRHFNKDGNSACLFVKPQRWEVWPLGSGIGKFISGPVRDFFFSQAYYDLEGKWPYGDWRHGDDGIIDYFIKRLSVSDKKMLLAVVRLSLAGIPVRQTKCPCNNAKRFKKCHWSKIQDLKKILPEDEWIQIYQLAKNF